MARTGNIIPVFLFLLIFLSTAISLNAQVDIYRIDSIAVHGNKRTRLNLIISELTFGAGQAVTQEEIEQSIQFLRNRDHFSSVGWDISVLPDSATVLTIIVKDKWSLYPIVYYSGTEESSDILFGAMDLNFLGRGIYLLASYGLKLTKGLEPRHNFNIDYRYEKVGGSNWGNYIELASEENAYYVMEDNTNTGSYNSKSTVILAGVDYNHRNHFIPQFRTGYRNDRFGDFIFLEQPLLREADNYRYIPVEWGGEINFLNNADHRFRGYIARLEFNHSLNFNHNSFTRFESEFQYHWLSDNERFFSVFRGQLRYSGASAFMYHQTMKSILRGSTGRRYYYPLVYGVNLEAGITPLRKEWLTMDLLGILDAGQGGDSFEQAFRGTLRYRAGGGVRLSWPGFQGLFLTFDLVVNEYNQPESFFGLEKFFDPD